jgi:hypothetical protein
MLSVDRDRRLAVRAVVTPGVSTSGQGRVHPDGGLLSSGHFGLAWATFTEGCT